MRSDGGGAWRYTAADGPVITLTTGEPARLTIRLDGRELAQDAASQSSDPVYRVLIVFVGPIRAAVVP